MICDKNGVIIKRFQDLVDSSGKTRQTIAKDLNCDTSTVTKQYNGDMKISVDYLVKYAKYFDVSTDYLLGLSKNRTRDMEINTISKKTGLSDNSVKSLIKLVKQNKLCVAGYDIGELSNRYLKMIDFILNDIELYSISTDGGAVRYPLNKRPLLQHIYSYFCCCLTDSESFHGIIGDLDFSFYDLEKYAYLALIQDHIKDTITDFKNMFPEEFKTEKDNKESPIPLDEDLPF